MVLVKVLKRKDASSVLVAILLAMIISTLLTSITLPLTTKITGNHNGPYGSGYGSWKDNYLMPAVWAVLQIIALEILTWIYVLVHKLVRRSK